MRVFRNKAFTRFARQADISDSVLCGVVAATGKGLIAASLGSSVFKQRIARPGQGKSGGFRVLLVFKAHERAIFVHGFAKKETENIGSDELTALRKLAFGTAGTRRQGDRARGRGRRFEGGFLR